MVQADIAAMRANAKSTVFFKEKRIFLYKCFAVELIHANQNHVVLIGKSQTVLQYCMNIFTVLQGGKLDLFAILRVKFVADGRLICARLTSAAVFLEFSLK